MSNEYSPSMTDGTQKSCCLKTVITTYHHHRRRRRRGHYYGCVLLNTIEDKKTSKPRWFYDAVVCSSVCGING